MCTVGHPLKSGHMRPHDKLHNIKNWDGHNEQWVGPHDKLHNIKNWDGHNEQWVGV